VRFVALGVRGSTPAPGADFVRYGGHTSCLAVSADHDETPRLVLDAGTGLRGLSRLLDGAAYRGDIALTHLHWDHVQGLPFSAAVDNPDAQVRLLLPVSGDSADARALLSHVMSPPYFPIGPEGLQGSWTFEPLDGARDDVAILPVPHKGGAAYALRVLVDDAVLAYVPDHALHSGTDAAALARVTAFVRGADVLVHDAEYVAAEQATAAEYGHATIETVLDLADRAAVGELYLTHHAPARTDDQLDELAHRFPCTPAGRPVTFMGQDETYAVAGQRSRIAGSR
jgi:phosphoribosyl 1,2-cyclic phosphodiesterase